MENKKFIVYKITNLINNKSYIGITSNIGKRIHQHFSLTKKRYKSHLYNSINKHGCKNFKIDSIDFAFSRQEVFKKEKYWIKELNTKNPSGYNLTNGGDGIVGYKHTQETKDKIAEARKGKRATQKTKDKIRKKAIGRKASKETIKKLSESHKGYKQSQEHIDKIAKANTGKKRTQEQRNRMSLAQKAMVQE